MPSEKDLHLLHSEQLQCHDREATLKAAPLTLARLRSKIHVVVVVVKFKHKDLDSMNEEASPCPRCCKYPTAIDLWLEHTPFLVRRIIKFLRFLGSYSVHPVPSTPYLLRIFLMGLIVPGWFLLC
jgi:hypothetical protein